jgi:hypothetical protein
MKKLAIASAIALMSAGSAFAQASITLETPQPQIAGVFQADAINIDNISGVTTSVFGTLDNLLAVRETDINGITTTTAGYDIAVLSGAINLARINGAIDISGTNVMLSSMANNVSATATATATTSTADAYAIAGAKLSTTVIGAMNSATVEVMGKVTDQSNAISQTTGIASLASQGQDFTVNTTAIEAAVLPVGLTGTGNLGNGLGTTELLNSVMSGGALTAGQFDMTGLNSELTASTTNKISELQNMAVFNTAVNAAALDAGIKVVASVDPASWFLNPQTGVVNLSNVAMATTAIGAMNSSVTRLGANLTPTVTVK